MTRPKPTVGQVLYRGNVNPNTGSVDRLVPVIVRKVGRKFFACSAADQTYYETTYHLDGWKEKTDFSPLTKIYESTDGLKCEQEQATLVSEISAAFNYAGGKGRKLHLETLRKIKELLT